MKPFEVKAFKVQNESPISDQLFHSPKLEDSIVQPRPHASSSNVQLVYFSPRQKNLRPLQVETEIISPLQSVHHLQHPQPHTTRANLSKFKNFSKGSKSKGNPKRKVNRKHSRNASQTLSILEQQTKELKSNFDKLEGEYKTKVKELEVRVDRHRSKRKKSKKKKRFLSSSNKKKAKKV
jgi:hypothetical protein